MKLLDDHQDKEESLITMAEQGISEDPTTLEELDQTKLNG